MKTTSKLITGFTMSGIALSILLSSNPAFAASCQTLYAGQNIPAGSVCVSNDADYLTVEYKVDAPWDLTEVHLFVGNSITEAPQTRSGNPQIGLFPYSATVSGGAYSFVLPMGDFGDCDADLVVAAHAVVAKEGSNGSLQTETGWAAGTRFTPRGNWATWFNYSAECPNYVGECSRTETAFAFGDQTLQDLGTGINRWGWQNTVSPYESGSQPLYAGAAQNDPSKGDLVGQVYYSFDGSWLDLTYQMAAGYGLSKTHVFAGAANLNTGAPGLFGHQQSHSFGTTFVNYYIDTGLTGTEDLFVVAHADVCFQQ
ncbi:MAG: hypothetical protein JJU03_13145 [Idiomarina sp.]|nr:hypothetical protein [Idiomarina sp.]